MENWRVLLVAAAVSPLLGGCGESPTDILSIHAYVTGHVTTSAGAPVSGTTVRIEATDQSSGAVITEGTTQTGADGAFAAMLGTVLVAPQTANVVVTATPAQGSSLAPGTVEGLSVDFSYNNPPADTLRVEVTLAER